MACYLDSLFSAQTSSSYRCCFLSRLLRTFVGLWRHFLVEENDGMGDLLIKYMFAGYAMPRLVQRRHFNGGFKVLVRA
jgi:hypothetical protein